MTQVRCVFFAGSTGNEVCSANMVWSYDQCPSVDECRLHLDDCHMNASCFNVGSSYTCSCNRGYIGDGRLYCNQT